MCDRDGNDEAGQKKEVGREHFADGATADELGRHLWAKI